MKEKSAYDQSREMLAAAYKSIKDQSSEHAATCYTCGGSGIVDIGPNKYTTCPTCRGAGLIVVIS